MNTTSNPQNLNSELREKLITDICYVINDYTRGDPAYMVGRYVDNKLLPLLASHFVAMPDDKELSATELVEYIRRGMLRDMGKDYPALKSGLTIEEAEQALLAWRERYAEEKREEHLQTVANICAQSMDLLSGNPQGYKEMFLARKEALTEMEKLRKEKQSDE